MTPKEKAKNIFEKYIYLQMFKGDMKADKEFAKESAKITVDELIQQMPSVYLTPDEGIHAGHRQYWEEVKKQLESF